MTKTNDNIDVYFKDALHKIVNESNANALDVALEKTNVRLRDMIERELNDPEEDRARKTDVKQFRGRRWSESGTGSHVKSVLRDDRKRYNLPRKRFVYS